MDFELPWDVQTLQDVVRRFVQQELIPIENQTRPEGDDIAEDALHGFQEKARAAGLWLVDVPAEYGGGRPGVVGPRGGPGGGAQTGGPPLRTHQRVLASG